MAVILIYRKKQKLRVRTKIHFKGNVSRSECACWKGCGLQFM